MFDPLNVVVDSSWMNTQLVLKKGGQPPHHSANVQDVQKHRAVDGLTSLSMPILLVQGH